MKSESMPELSDVEKCLSFHFEKQTVEVNNLEKDLNDVQ